MRFNRCFLTMVAVVLLITPVVLRAQTDTGEGKIQGNYNMHQTFEMGWQATSRDGSEAAYGTFVNLDDGFRIFEQSMSMRSLNHQGTIFDNFYESSFGFGGDPNQVARLRMSKNKWYNFNASFRRDYNAWNYDLIGNPLNPPNVPGTPLGTCTLLGPGGTNGCFPANTAVAYSPHALDTVRRMADFDLTLAPQSRFRGRLGFSRITTEGPQLSSFHEGTDIALYQRTRWTQDSYRMGFDFRPVARTVISYDQYIQNYKQDPKIMDAALVTNPFGNLNVGNPAYVLQGTQINFDAGLPWDPYSNRPCTNPIAVQPTSSTPAQIVTNCNGYQFYGGFAGSSLPTALQSNFSATPRTMPETFWTPTETITLQSNYWKDVDLVGRFSYSKSEVNWLWNELGIGYISRTNERQFAFGGPGGGSRYVANGDFGFTWRITDRLRLNDSFLYNNFRLPSFWNSTDNALFGTNNLFTPLSLDFVAANCTMATYNNPALCPTHARPSGGSASSRNGSASSSGAEVANEFLAGYLDQRITSNKVELEFDINRRVGARIGYRFTDRQIVDKSFATAQEIFYPGISGALPGPGQGATWTQNSSVFDPANPTANRWYNNAARGDCAAVPGPTTGTWVLPAGCTLQPNGAITFDNTSEPETDAGWLPIHEHGAIAGLFFRPVDSLRINFDVELMTASSACPVGNADCFVGQAVVTRISPRHLQNYNFRTKWTPKQWLSLNGSVHIIETRNNDAISHYLAHNRYYGFGATLNPNDRWALDFGYNYNGVASGIDDCFVATVGNPAIPIGSSAPCTLPSYPAGNSYQGGRSVYTDTTHYGYFNLMFKPEKHVSFNAGLDVLNVGGNALLLGAYQDPNNPGTAVPLSTLGPQDYTFYRPTLGIAVAVSKEITLKSNWRYYDYGENAQVGPTIMRNFTGHVVDVALRYSF